MNKKLNIKRVILVLILLFLILICLCAGVFFYMISPVDKDAKSVNYEVKSGVALNTIYEDLESKEIVKSALFMKIYTKFAGEISVEAGSYKISASMGGKDIYNVLKGKSQDTLDTMSITFKEGRNVRDLGSSLEKNGSNITSEELINKMNDKDYVNELINKYWFLTDAVLNDDLYYKLEGYLFPDTYTFYKETTAEVIIEKMLDRTEEILADYKTDIENSGKSIHEILTLASIIELESAGTNYMDRVSGVFSNRLNTSGNIGSCVTTYYAFKINQGDRDLTNAEINDCNTKYNTRCNSFVGLPVGPIGNAGKKAIEAAIHPEVHDYYYFVSDKNGDLYFSRTLDEHNNTITDLDNRGLWYEY